MRAAVGIAGLIGLALAAGAHADGTVPECYNASVNEPGNTVLTEYRLSGATQSTHLTEMKVVGTAMFEGQEVIEAHQTVTIKSPAAGEYAARQRLYYRIKPDGTIVSHGIAHEMDGGDRINIITPFPEEAPWKLKPGESEEYSYTYSISMKGNVPPLPPEVTGGLHTNAGVNTYIGRESITVPAGTFNACHTTHTLPGGTPTNAWTAPASAGGFLLKQIQGEGSDEIVIELMRGTINGKEFAELAG